MPDLIVDIGSCWGNGIETAKRCIRDLAGIGVQKVKYQLCKASNGNKPIPAKMLKDLVTFGVNHQISVSASVWDKDGYDAVTDSGAKWVKFAHSAYDTCQELIEQATKAFPAIYITKPLMASKCSQSDKITWLWTYEINGVAVYPVTCQLRHSGMYGDMYNGFSNHSHGSAEAIEATRSGANVIEIHGNPLGVNDVPDAAFALSLDQINSLITGLKHI